jgi:hypothetical protein
MSEKPQFGFLYMTHNTVSKLFTYMAYKYPGKLPRSKFIYIHHQFNNKSNSNDKLKIGAGCNEKCITKHRWKYVSEDGAITEFIKDNPDIKYDKWEDIMDMEEDYDSHSDFFKDYFDRLLNMGIPNPTECRYNFES